ncbi:hypothetical protein GCM10008915_71480 [Bifidobacterium pullorum subsp. gallinarum]
MDISCYDSGKLPLFFIFMVIRKVLNILTSNRNVVLFRCIRANEFPNMRIGRYAQSEEMADIFYIGEVRI